MNYTLSFNDLPELPPEFPADPEKYELNYRSIRYWEQNLYLKGYIYATDFPVCGFIIKFNPITLDYEYIMYENSFLPNDGSELYPYENMDIDDQGRIWLVVEGGSPTFKTHSYNLDTWEVNSTIKFIDWWFPKGNLSELEEELTNTYSNDYIPTMNSWSSCHCHIEGMSLVSNCKKVIFSLQFEISHYLRYVGLRLNSY